MPIDGKIHFRDLAILQCGAQAQELFLATLPRSAESTGRCTEGQTGDIFKATETVAAESGTPTLVHLGMVSIWAIALQIGHPVAHIAAGGENFLQARNEVRSFEFEC
jgi:hypothetical protein